MLLQYTVQCTFICRKESKQVTHNCIYFMQVNDLDANKSWYELGEEVGLEIVDDEEEEEEKCRKKRKTRRWHVFLKKVNGIMNRC